MINIFFEFIQSYLQLIALFCLVSFLLNFLKFFFHQSHLDQALKTSGLKGSLLGATIGALTPVCSCSVSGIFAGLLASGASPTAATAFLFAAPSINEFALAAIFGFAGILGVVVYLFFGFSAAVLTGLFSPYLKLRLSYKHLAEEHHHSHGFLHALKLSFDQTQSTLKKLLPSLFIGVALSLLLHNLLPNFSKLISSFGQAWYGPILATLVGLPLHVEATSAASVILPIIKTGLPLGTGISLLMATTISSLSEVSILPKVIGWQATVRLITWYFIYCSLLGLILNQIFR